MTRKTSGHAHARTRRGRLVTRLRNYFLTGLLVTGPIAITLYLAWTVIKWVDSIVKPLVPEIYNPDTYLPFSLPGLGLILVLAALMLIGFLTANFGGRALISLSELIVQKMPFIRTVYNGLKQLFETVLAERSENFQQPVLVQYPRPGIWAVAFISSETRGEIRQKLGAEANPVAVFLPTTPNPTSGFLLFVPRKDLIPLDMSLEEAAKLVISAGLVAP